MSTAIVADRYRNGNSQPTEHPDTRLVLTRSGLAVECRRCGRVLAVEATPPLRPVPTTKKKTKR